MKVIPQQEIVQRVMQALVHASHSIHATMNLHEELAGPLPEAYYKLLLGLLHRGVHMHRQAFGSMEEFQIFQKLDPCKGLYRLEYCTHKPYQRMILIDEHVLFCKKNNIFYTSETPADVQEFLEYFRR